ncbi:MAG: TetR/AcrR family transcriptional regulator, partial [Bacteroidales bacterium]|nr:TetR/AcrR family transcriptional regulator [Bacteroidales bacterium]
MTTKKENTTELAILDAAEELFLKSGYAKTSTVQIAKLAGCNQALVHYYYRSKENLFRQVFEKKAIMFASSVLQVAEVNSLPF